jgi:uncharacterized protein YdaU (DUF1376 family)
LSWMPFYPADYLADTGHLTTQEHGAYFLLILHYWCNSGLPADERKLARIARLTDSEWTSVRDTIADFFDANWQHFRINAELATARERHEARAIAGSKGGRARLKQCLSNAQAGLNQPQPQPQPQSSEAVASAPTVLETPEARLFRVGVEILDALGVPEKRSRPIIGRWRRDTGDDCNRVLAAIYRAQEMAVSDPPAFITAMLKPQGKPHGSTENLVTAAKRLAEQGVSFGPRPGSLRGDALGNVVRMLPKDGGE